jgi:NAD(P)-dependent dehydrogenase (short-subunit alcohol dehydrogenase family)
MRLQNKIAAITGAGSGIGLAAARIFSAEGATVLILEMNSEAGEKAREEILKSGGKASFYQVDISSHEQVKAVFRKIDADFGGLDVLYNNASVFWGVNHKPRDNRLGDLDMDAFETILRINLFGLAYCTKYAIPLLKKRGGGAIINTSSSCGVIGIPGCDAYSTAKGGTISLTRALAVEYGPDHIRTNCIAPAAIKTPMVQESDLCRADFDEQAFLDHGTPIRRWGYAEDIARTALFLASDEGSYINGAVIVADGGITVS